MTTAPDILYHYTSAKGLLGILESNTLWASNLSYMNDFSELKYTANLVDDELMKAMVSNPGLTDKYLGHPFDRIMKPLAVYACCFCEKGDQLSQWRAYTEKGTGYALGFDAKQLQQNQMGSTLKKAVYEPEEQLKSLRPSITRYINKFDKPEENLSSISVYEIFMHYLFFKDPAFSEEREWRAVTVKRSIDVEELHFREMQGTVVPYIEMKFPTLESDKKNHLPIIEIIQGPLVDPSLGENSLKSLLKKYGYDNVATKRSSVPIRF